MAFPPVAIFIGGSQLEGYTSMTLRRSKEDLTGSCTVDLFFNYLPESPVIVDAAVAKEFLVYIGGNLAFTGTIDRRDGTGTRDGVQRRNKRSGRFESGSTSGVERTVGIGPNGYTVTLSARGKTKRAIDSSHQHKSTNMLKTTSKKALEKLLEPFDIQLEWLGTEVNLDKVRFRDGAKVIEEIRRIAAENGYYMYETRDGKLRVTDDIGPGQGDALVLGQNILSFSASQSEEQAQSEITVKGQRTGKDVWGEQAILQDTTTVFKDSWVPSYSPIVVQHYGDGTKEALERRARFEANKRSSLSKEVTIEVFHVMAQGAPWDVGNLHYVEVPPEGIFDTFECTELEYHVTAEGDLSTSLTLSPPPSGQQSASGLEAFSTTDQSLQGVSQQAAKGVSVAPGNYPFPWSGPTLTLQTKPAAVSIIAALAGVTGLEAVAREGITNTPPLTLPTEFDT